jgi:transposase
MRTTTEADRVGCRGVARLTPDSIPVGGPVIAKDPGFLGGPTSGSVMGEGDAPVMAAPRKYSDELRERAVGLVFESGRPIAHVARDLGIHKEALRHWVRQTEADTGRRRDLLTTDERDELKRLRRENAELRRANAILKDASVYFATELDPTRRR